MNVKIYFDNIEQNKDDFEGLKNSTFTFRSRDENGENGLSFSPELKVYDNAYAYIKQNIIQATTPQLTQIKAQIYDACCADSNGNPIKLLEGKIEGADVEWCEIPCESATISVIDNTADAKAIACLKNTIIWDKKQKFDGSGLSDGENSFRAAPNTPYCISIKPNFLHECILILGVIVKIVVAPLWAFAALVGGSAAADAIMNEIGQIATGCGNSHRTPFIHSYLSNLCDVCGLQLQSSIFGVGGPYHDTMRLDAKFVKGGDIDSFEKNKPNLNGIQFLEEFKQFNIDWRVSNGALIIERKDYDFAGLWFDLSTVQKDNIYELCFSLTTDTPPAYAEYEYAKDGVDNTGDEANRDWSEFVFDWNTPPLPSQAGLYRQSFTFGTGLFRKDAARESISPIDKPLYSFFYPLLDEYEGCLLMEKGLASYPKMFIWNRDATNVGIARRPTLAGDTYYYNIDWWVKKDPFLDGVGVANDTLYQRFFYIDNPRVSGIKKRKFTLRMKATCDLVATLSPDKFIRIPLDGTMKDARIEEIEYNTDNSQFTITGLV